MLMPIENTDAGDVQVELAAQLTPPRNQNDRCPHCGYCPHCGQSRNQRPHPYEYVPVQYPWQSPINDLPVFPNYRFTTTGVQL